ncbi:putative reverse transcriptase domain-containing protein [Tanacetum coccineum]
MSGSQQKKNSSTVASITFGTTPICSKSVRIKSSGGVFTAKKPLIFLRLATMDPPGDIMARTTLPKRCLTPVSIGPQFIVMPMTWLNPVTLVNVTGKSRKKMKCPKMPSKFMRFLMYGASILWDHSRLHEGTSTYSWLHLGKEVHNTFHVSNLKKCYADKPLAIPLDGLHIDEKLHFVEEPVEIMDCEVKRLKQILPLPDPYSAATLFGGVTMKEGFMLDLTLFATSASYIMLGHPVIPEARGKAYAIGGGDTNPGSNVVTGTFLLNNHYAFVLFNSGADRSFVSTTFSTLLDIIPDTLDVSYAVELADERIAKKNTMLKGCTIGLLGHPFNINLMPLELGSFDVIIGMDWLASNHAVIVCDEKIVRIPFGDEILIVQGDRSAKGKKLTLSIISCTKTQKYMEKDCQVFLAQVTKKETEVKSQEKRLKDVPIVQKFPEVFPEDLPGL